LIERCDKCGKAFMDKSEVKRHKMYEHIVPVSPFEEVKEEKENKEEESPYQNITDTKTNEPDNIRSLEQLQNKTTTPANVNTKRLDDNINTDNSSNYNKINNNSTTIGNRLRSFRPFRL
jgi:hypothetical protein